MSSARGPESAQGPIPVLPERTRVVYGAPQGVAFAAYVALERGYFAEANVDLELETVDVPAIAPNLTTGQIDVGHSPSAPGLFNALARGLPLRAILDAAHLAPGGRSHMIVARQDQMRSSRLLWIKFAVTGKVNDVGMGRSIDEGLKRRFSTRQHIRAEQSSYGFCFLERSRQARQIR